MSLYEWERSNITRQSAFDVQNAPHFSHNSIPLTVTVLSLSLIRRFPPKAALNSNCQQYDEPESASVFPVNSVAEIWLKPTNFTHDSKIL
jgi:hypothetical protein